MSSHSSSKASPVLWTSDLNPAGFFHERVVAAQERQHVKLSENVEHYLVTLLCDYVRTRSDVAQDEDCLALILKRALESPYGEQVMLFKHLGDTALYFSGFFQEYFNRKCFDVKYYVSMGESAYGQLATLMSRRSQAASRMGDLYGEMSRSFSQAVDILLDVSENTGGMREERETLSIYDAWLSTESRKLERDLHARGINPVRVKKRTLQ